MGRRSCGSIVDHGSFRGSEAAGSCVESESIEVAESVEIKGDTFTAHFKIRDIYHKQEKIKIDPSEKPATIDLTSEEKGKKEVRIGIYKYEKGEFTLVTAPSDERPKDFKSVKGVTVMVVWQIFRGSSVARVGHLDLRRQAELASAPRSDTRMALA
jgi:uncharacterized protein (TIGR03067 family)